MIRVEAVRASERELALRTLLDGLPRTEQAAQIADLDKAAQAGRISFEGLLVARRDHRIVGAALYVMQPDRTVFVWPASCVAGEDRDAVADALLSEVRLRIDAAAAWIGQSLVDPKDVDHRLAFERNGFPHLTDLRFLVRPLRDYFDESTGRALLTRIEYRPGVNDARFEAVLDRTYINTRDCPELEGRRRSAEILQGHRVSGEFDPSRWWLYQYDGRDAALLLMNDHPEQDAWEVVYMGVAADCRGKGIGRDMLAEGLSTAEQAGRNHVLLAVDCRNDYAMRIYEQMGFLQADVKSVHAHFPPRN